MIAAFFRQTAFANLILVLALLLPMSSGMAQETMDSMAVEQEMPSLGADLQPKTLVTSGYLWRVLLVTTLLLGLLLLALMMYRKLNGYSGSIPSMQIVARTNIGPRQSLLLVSVHGRRLLLGVTEQQIQLLTELDQEPEEFFPASEAKEESEGFMAVMKRIGSTMNARP